MGFSVMGGAAPSDRPDHETLAWLVGLDPLKSRRAALAHTLKYPLAR